MSYMQAKNWAKKNGSAVSVVIIDAKWNHHNFLYAKEMFPNTSFEMFVSKHWSKYGDREADIRFSAA